MARRLLRMFAFLFVALFLLARSAHAAPPSAAPGYSFQRGGWTYVHLQGTPGEIGYQHGLLLAPQIADFVRVLQIEALHSTHRNWQFYRETARTMLWPHIPAEYQAELRGIARGVKAAGGTLDLWDIVAVNGDIELTQYYVPWLEKRGLEKRGLEKQGIDKHTHAQLTPSVRPEGRCSAFIATGSYTKGGQIVIAHNNWTGYAAGERWTIVFDIAPTHGHRMIMDGAPGIITSQDDFGENDAGLMITETTITDFLGWKDDGIPEFARSREAMQYATSIDQYVDIMRKGNNGGYANDWLIGDRKTGEIAYLELGLKHSPLWRTKDGYFVSSNFARDPEVIRDETPGFNPRDLSTSPNARHVTWDEKMAEYKGRIDLKLAEEFLGDHYDSYVKKVQADQRSLCGHVENVKAGIPEWDWAPYYPGGAVTGKAADSEMAAHMELAARAGHPCGEDFHAAPFLAAHPQYGYLKPVLKDMDAGPWTVFSAGEQK
ncbi:MAG TPA: C45 family peptidase [Terracidiphilus sp.]|nr:C45 family peptidase [Terracidiphilus sp.]